MRFLGTLFWIVVTVIVIVFSAHNWQPVTLNLFGGLQADIKLPVLLLLTFLIGFLPLYVYYRVVRWRYVRRNLPAPAATPIIEPPLSEPL